MLFIFNIDNNPTPTYLRIFIVGNILMGLIIGNVDFWRIFNCRRQVGAGTQKKT